MPSNSVSSTVTSGGTYPAALGRGTTTATFFPIERISSASSSSMTTLFSDGAIPGPIFGAPKSYATTA